MFCFVIYFHKITALNAQSATSLSLSGELTLEEFISGAREHPDIMDMLTKMMDLTHVLEIIVKGQRRKALNWVSKQQAEELTSPRL